MLDRRQRHVHDRRVQHHHQLSQAQHRKRDPAPALASTLGLATGGCLLVALCGLNAFYRCGRGAHVAPSGLGQGNNIAGIIHPTSIILLAVMIAPSCYNRAAMGKQNPPADLHTADLGSMVLLTRLAKQVYRRSTEELLGIHMRLVMALSYLRDHDGAPQQELAEALCMDANNVVLLLNELEDLGHVARRRDPEDRRRHRVELTEQGRRALVSAERAQETIEDEVLQALDAEGRATLWKLLTRALRAAEPDIPVDRAGTTVGSVST